MPKRTRPRTPEESDELARLREENQRLRLALSAEYERGNTDGWSAARELYWTHMQRLNDDFYKYGVATYYAFGIVTAGFGNVPLVMLKDLEGKIAEATARIQNEVGRNEQITGETIDFASWIAESDEIREAMRAMYQEKDNGEKLRAIASRFNPMIAANIQRDRILLKPGTKKKTVLDRLCDRMKVYRDQGMTFPEGYAEIEKLYTIPNPDENTQEEIEWLGERADPLKSIENAYRIRHGKGKNQKVT